jgi:serine kinase of HPr protein (carbohydrate metabolism regulator)
MHATCVFLAGKGVLITGPSGSGKSDLALRLIDQAGYGISDGAMRAQLVADDQVVLTTKSGSLFASPPHDLEGLLEVRGLGIVRMHHASDVRISLIVRLVAGDQIERLPAAPDMTDDIAGVNLPSIALSAASSSAPAKVRTALFALLNDDALLD